MIKLVTHVSNDQLLYGRPGLGAVLVSTRHDALLNAAQSQYLLGDIQTDGLFHDLRATVVAVIV